MRNSLAPVRKTSPKRTEEDSSASPRLPLRQKPFLLLHICCGPCSTHVIDLLKDKYHPIGFFYNPNLHPKQEYFRRLEATAQVCRQHRAALWVPPFGEDAWLDGVGRGTGGRRTLQYLHPTQAGGDGMGGKSCIPDGLCNDPDHKSKEK